MTEKHSLCDPRNTLRISFVRIGLSNNLQRMVSFHRPSIKLSVTSMGHGDISFFETPIDCSN